LHLSNAERKMTVPNRRTGREQEGRLMALALGMTKYTPAATKALIAEGPVARAAYFKRFIENMGGKVLGYYFAEGADADVVALVDVPDDQRSIPISVAFGALNWASGMAESLRLTWLTTPEEFEAALKSASGIAAPGEEK
jgi:uncharacterized protein with GYD domain